MTRDTRSIVIDPFFDGEGEVQAIPHARPVTPPSQHGYQDAGAVELASGRPMAGVMRPSAAGLRGTVIPHATMGGIPIGTRPHATRDLEVNIDPHISGQSSIVRLGDVTEAAIEAATQQAQQVTPEPYNIETQRLRGAAIMHGVAARNRRSQPAMQPQAVAVDTPNDYVRPPQPFRQVRPLQAFNQQQPPAAEHNGRELRAIDLRDERPVGGRVPPPTIKVTFEIEQFGTHEAYYHDVIFEEGIVVLVFKTGFAGAKYFPNNRGENPPPMAINVEGTQDAHLVHTTGIQYAYEGAEFCVLMIDRTWQLPAQ